MNLNTELSVNQSSARKGRRLCRFIPNAIGRGACTEQIQRGLSKLILKIHIRFVPYIYISSHVRAIQCESFVNVVHYILYLWMIGGSDVFLVLVKNQNPVRYWMKM